MAGTKDAHPSPTGATAADAEMRRAEPMADAKVIGHFTLVGATAAAEAAMRATLKSIELALRGEEPRTAEARERALAGALAEIADDFERRSPELFDRLRQQMAEPLAPGFHTAEQAVVEAWDAADVDNRLDALLARLAETEARLDLQLARLDAEGG